MTIFQSRFSHVLDTNYMPTPSEMIEIMSLLDGPEGRIKAINEELKRLQEERDELESFIVRHRMLLSPFRRIPADIWGEIFVHALPDHLPCRTLKEAPLLLTSICRSWREIALRTPRLWNTIYVHLPPIHPTLQTLMQQRKEGVKRWLDRSGSLPITFALALPGPTGDPFEDMSSFIADFIELLFSCSRRLKWIQILPVPEGSPENEIVSNRFAQLTPEDLPLLKELRISRSLFNYDYQSRDPNERPRIQRPLAELVSGLTSLRSLHLLFQPIPSVLALPIRWGNLHHLEISSEGARIYTDPVQILVTISKLCSSLSHLKLSLGLGRGLPSTIPSALPTPQVANFRSLELKTQEHTTQTSNLASLHRILTATFQSIVAPNLESLTLNTFRMGHMQRFMDSEDFHPISTPFEDLIIRSQCPLTHLSIDEFIVERPTALSRSLGFIPSLTSLRVLSQRHTNKPSVKALQTLTGDLYLCSNLEEVVLDCNTQDVGTIRAFVDARPRISTLSVQFGNINTDSDEEAMIASEQVKAWLEKVRKRGTRVEWGWKSHKIDYGRYDSPWPPEGSASAHALFPLSDTTTTTRQL